MNNSSTNSESKSGEKSLEIYCKRCKEYNSVRKGDIFSGGEYAKYATKCPNCGLGRPLPYKAVESVFGELEV